MRITMILMILLAASCTSPKRQYTDAEYDQIVAEYNKTVGPKDQVTCKHEPNIGTRIARRMCKTARQIERERVATQETITLQLP
ncbi:MAG: hypothetical protein CMQ21_07420 [Gammaproteobacteria bacterium]|jgi:hypothetical protein|nr:hypothetical protein [Gammaproteobacteria bacterium]|tara:strand:+ start:915 stop:1166 length:252 start_codon:yes stop_codon:yes gene_type:complete